jgi:PAS domain S-box-containing protein
MDLIRGKMILDRQRQYLIELSGGSRFVKNLQQDNADPASSGHFEAVIASAMDAIITVDERQEIVFFNPAAELMFGIATHDALNQPITNLIPEEFRAGHEKHIERFRATGVTGRRMGALGAISGLRSSGETFRIEASISQANIGGKWLATVILRDITERLANEEARLLLSQEVDHRAKNALAVVQAIVKLTSAESTEQYVEAISGRFDALARAHSLLARGSWKGGDLGQIIDEEMVGFQQAGQIRYEGPHVTLSAKSVQPVSLMFHELATNAVKHGALSVDRGTVTIGWRVLHDGSLALRWTEAGGPRVTQPERQGFGSSLIATLSGQLRSRATNDWLEEGLDFTMILPPAAFKLRLAPEGDDKPGSPPGDGAGRRPRRVLVVEDEAIVAMVLVSGLKADGWEVIGPASTIEEAYQLLADEAAPDVAILDINLEGVPVYPLAQVLQARHISFAFYSGYSMPVPDPRFQHVPLIGKPARAHVIDAELSRLAEETPLVMPRS